jgi:UDP-2-acetamido-3-amino-2,3-dideoxy-glucuronate N-acetyltransferase
VLGVVGAGRWGRNHLRNFAALGALDAVCDTSREALDRVTQAHPGVTVYPALEDLLADAAIQAVVIATPAELHFPQARAALAAGRHVLVEKPMALSLADAEELDRMAARHKRVLMVGHLLEYHPAFVKLRELVSAGELGEILRIDCHRFSPWVPGRQEGVLWDLAPHDLSMVLRLVGALPERVQAIGSGHLPGSAGFSLPAEAIVTLVLAFPSGVRAQMLLSWLYPVKEQRLMIVGRRRTAVFDDVRKEGKLRLYPTRMPGGTGEPFAASAEGEVVPCSGDEPLRLECQHFLRCIRAGGQPLTDGASGVRVTRVLDACERSLCGDGAGVRLRP